MKILIVNKFLYPKGGDSNCALGTGALLQDRGHEILYWGMDHPANETFAHRGLFVPYVDYENPGGWKRKLGAAMNVLYSREARDRMRRLLKTQKPDVVHLHNFAHQISPSILDALADAAVPCVMTMHDYKMVCASYRLRARGGVCEACAGGKHYHCLVKKCVKDSMLKSAVNTLEMYLHHRIWNIYDRIRLFIAPSRFLKAKLAEMGFRKNVVYLPNFSELAPPNPDAGSYALYFGRLQPEKGLRTLLDAFAGSKHRLKIAGDGPLRAEMESAIASRNLTNVELTGHLSGAELAKAIRGSSFVVLASEWYENNPLSVIEAFSNSKPVLGSRIGGIPELVRDGETGLTFAAGSSGELRSKMEQMFDHPQRTKEMGARAREWVRTELSPSAHYERLMELYQRALN